MWSAFTTNLTRKCFHLTFHQWKKRQPGQLTLEKKSKKVKVITPTVESCITQVGYRRSQISKDKVSKVKVFILQ